MELMVVIFIITALSGLVLGAAKYAQTKAARARAEAEITAMENALENYKNDNGVYPASTLTRASPIPPGVSGLPEKQNSHALYGALSGTIPAGSKQYFTFKLNQLREDPPGSGYYYIIDPFGSPYNYFCTPPPWVVPNVPVNQVTFDLWSYGPDGMIGLIGGVDHDADNITNWKQ
jgi:type II secretory pathway pseudopilin PulG